MLIKLVCILLLIIGAHSHTVRIPEAIKKEYGNMLYSGFLLQAEGLSTSAFCQFDLGCEKALQAGESPRKIESIRQLFVWYRTYGYHLGLIAKNPNITGQYYRRLSSHSNHWNLLPPPHANPEVNANRREYLFGVGEILSGVLCCWIMPPPAKLRVGLPLVVDGGKRVFNAVNFAIMQKDIAAIELEKRLEALKAATNCDTCQ